MKEIKFIYKHCRNHFVIKQDNNTTVSKHIFEKYQLLEDLKAIIRKKEKKLYEIEKLLLDKQLVLRNNPIYTKLVKQIKQGGL